MIKVTFYIIFFIIAFICSVFLGVLIFIVLFNVTGSVYFAALITLIYFLAVSFTVFKSASTLALELEEIKEANNMLDKMEKAMLIL